MINFPKYLPYILNGIIMAISISREIRVTRVIAVIWVLSVNSAGLQAKLELPELLARLDYLN